MGINEYEALLQIQGGRCAICNARPRGVRLALDHTHGHEACGGKGCEGCWRGLLCSKCNHELLGAAHDSRYILQAADAYLAHPPTSGEWRRLDRDAPVEDPPPF